jgi:hypothetical protein
LLRQLGAPAAWRAEGSPAELLAPLVQRAADTARRIALGEPEPPAGSGADPSAPSPRRKKKAVTKREARRDAKRDVERGTTREVVRLDAKRETGPGTKLEVGTPVKRRAKRTGARREKSD